MDRGVQVVSLSFMVIYNHFWYFFSTVMICNYVSAVPPVDTSLRSGLPALEDFWPYGEYVNWIS